MAKETIKDRVIQAAHSDPFLSIEEIAALVDTTPRYVRTILSEARLSLMQLRKKYARSIEKQLDPTRHNKSIIEVDPQLRINKITDATLAKLLEQDAKQELLQVSQLQVINQRLVYLELVTYGQLSLGVDKGSLRQMLFGSKQAARLQQKRSWAEVVLDQPQLATLIATKADQPLLKLGYLLYEDQRPVAVEMQWLDPQGIMLTNKTGIFEIADELVSR